MRLHAPEAQWLGLQEPLAELRRGGNLCDVSLRSQDGASFEAAKKWLKRLRKERPDPSMPIALAGNKSDATSSRAVSAEAAEAFAQENALEFFETSAKTGNNVDSMFVWIAGNLPPAVAAASGPDSIPPLNMNNNGGKGGGCC